MPHRGRSRSRSASTSPSSRSASASPSSASASGSESSRSPSPVPVRSKKTARRGSATTKKATEKKRTHWLTLVKAIYAAKNSKGAEGLTAAMREGKKHLASFKSAFADVPSESSAVEWVRGRL